MKPNHPTRWRRADELLCNGGPGLGRIVSRKPQPTEKQLDRERVRRMLKRAKLPSYLLPMLLKFPEKQRPAMIKLWSPLYDRVRQALVDLREARAAFYEEVGISGRDKAGAPSLAEATLAPSSQEVNHG